MYATVNVVMPSTATWSRSLGGGGGRGDATLSEDLVSTDTQNPSIWSRWRAQEHNCRGSAANSQRQSPRIYDLVICIMCIDENHFNGEKSNNSEYFRKVEWRPAAERVCIYRVRVESLEWE